jgi:molybdopterin converting factor small subunit
MSVEIEISSIFSKYTGGQSNIKVEGKTVGECLRAMASRYPEFGEMLLDEKGDLTQSFDIYVNGESAYPGTMRRPVKAGDKINIVLIVHGG